MKQDTFKPAGGTQEISLRGGAGSPMMPQSSPFAAVPVDTRPNQSIRDLSGRGGNRAKGSAPQGAQQVQLAQAPAPQDGITIPRRPSEAPAATMAKPRPFLHRAAPRSVDAYSVTLVGVAPDGQTYEVAIPFKAEFPAGTRLGSPEITQVEG